MPIVLGQLNRSFGRTTVPGGASLGTGFHPMAMPVLLSTCDGPAVRAAGPWPDAERRCALRVCFATAWTRRRALDPWRRPLIFGVSGRWVDRLAPTGQIHA